MDEGSCVSSLKSGVARPTSNDNVDVDQGNDNAWLGRHAAHDSRLRAHPCVNRDRNDGEAVDVSRDAFQNFNFL